MKAKRLTALALAALMAASTTSVALAGERVDYDLDVVTSPTVQYYKYDSDAGMLVKVENDDFQPGDDVYILLQENGPALTGKKTYNAYGTWQIGDSWVKDIDLVYRKGAISTPGATTTKYVLKNMPTELKALEGKEVSANTLEALMSVVEASSEYQTLITNKVNSEYKKTAYQVTATKELVATENEAAEKSIDKAITDSLVTETAYKTVDGQPYKTLPDYIKSASSQGYVDAGTWYTASSLADALKANGWHPYDSTYEGTAKLYYASGEDSKNYGGIDVNNTGGTAVSSAPANVYVNVAAENASTTATFKFIDVSKIQSAEVAEATEQRVKAATTEYYDSNSSNKLVTVKDEPTGYFKNSGDVFLGADKVTAGKAYKGYTTVEAFYDDSGISDADGAKAAAKKKVDASLNLSVANIDTQTTTGQPTTVPQYEYWIKITTKDSTTTKDIDVVGKVSVGTSKSSAEKDQEVSVDFTLTNSEPGNGNHDEATDYVSIEPGERAVVSFADDASDEFEVEFGDDARFVFNARGQGKLNLAYNTKYNKDFAYDYDDANIDFINFEGEPTTNRTGTLYIYADEDSYIYEVTSKGAKKINGAYYDDDEEAWVIRTRNLTSYAISDKKLKTVDQMDNGSSSNSSNKPDSSNNKPGNGKPNPDTGR